MMIPKYKEKRKLFCGPDTQPGQKEIRTITKLTPKSIRHAARLVDPDPPKRWMLSCSTTVMTQVSACGRIPIKIMSGYQGIKLTKIHLMEIKIEAKDKLTP